MLHGNKKWIRPKSIAWSSKTIKVLYLKCNIGQACTMFHAVFNLEANFFKADFNGLDTIESQFLMTLFFLWYPLMTLHIDFILNALQSNVSCEWGCENLGAISQFFTKVKGNKYLPLSYQKKKLNFFPSKCVCFTKKG